MDPSARSRFESLVRKARAAARRSIDDARESVVSASGWSRWLSLAIVVLLPVLVIWPWLADMSTLGFHDWDVQASHRYLVVKTLSQFHQFPGYDPYACGGFPAWGYVEADTIVVSPFLPLYLWATLPVAIRIEVLSMALFGSIGTYLLAGRFTSSPPARALVVALFAVNGRWALQTAAGHTWHLAYALLPWSFFAFERAREGPVRASRLAWLAASFAALIYTGGIYPLPHTVLVVGLWAVGVSVVDRSIRPLLVLGAAGVLAVCLAAPKLLPMLATFGRAPREIASDETLSIGAFLTLLTSRDQAFYSRPAQVSPYGWHEWGMYIGFPAVLLLGLGMIFVSGKREGVLKLIAIVLVLLGFGAFHPDAPWPWLHAHLPVFRSQHVPSRFFYPAVLVGGLVVAAGIGRWLSDRGERRGVYEIVATVLVGALALDIALVAQKPMADAMWMVVPEGIPRDNAFSTVKNPPYQYVKPDWAGPMYLAMLGNTGVLDCYGAPPFTGKGALAKGEPGYRGETYLEGPGSARVTRWTPNEVTVTVEGASNGSRLVYNTNFDAGWSATVVHEGTTNGAAALSQHARLATVVPEGASEVVFRYSPPRLFLGLTLFVLAAAALLGLGVMQKRRE